MPMGRALNVLSCCRLYLPLAQLQGNVLFEAALKTGYLKYRASSEFKGASRDHLLRQRIFEKNGAAQSASPTVSYTKCSTYSSQASTNSSMHVSSELSQTLHGVDYSSPQKARKHDYTQPKAYRPIALLNALGKTMGNIIAKVRRSQDGSSPCTVAVHHASSRITQHPSHS